MEKRILMRRGVLASDSITGAHVAARQVVYRKQAEELVDMVMEIVSEAESIEIGSLVNSADGECNKKGSHVLYSRNCPSYGHAP